MILYHFTALEYLDSIMATGLTKGEVPLSETECLNAVNLTTDADPSGHGLSEARPLTEEERELFGKLNGRPLPEGARFANKRAVRIKVMIPSSDRNLHYWPKWASKRLDRKWYKALDIDGGRKSKTWWIYFGSIPPESFHAVDVLEPQRP